MKEINGKKMRLELLTAVTLLVIAVEWWATFQLSKEALTFPSFLFIHGALVCIIAFYTYYSSKQQIYVNLHMILFLQTLFLGIFGAVMTLVSIGRYIAYSYDATAFSDWLDSLFPEDNQKDSEKLYERISFGLNDKSDEYVEPFADLMVYGSTLNKQALIARATRYFRPSFAPVLQAALHDKNNIIRVQAASSIAKIEDNFFKEYKIREAGMDEAPDSYNVNFEFATFCLDYIASGILGDKRSQAIAQKTIEVLNRCIRLEPFDEIPQFLLSCLYVKQDMLNEAYDLLKQLIERESFLIPELIKTYIDCLFKLKKFKKLRTFCSDALAGNINIIFIDDELRDLLTTWSGGVRELDGGTNESELAGESFPGMEAMGNG